MKKKKQLDIYLSMLVTTVFLLGTVLLWQALERNDHAKIKLVVDVKRNEVKNQLENVLEERILSFIRMAKRWEFLAQSKKEWLEDAKNHRVDMLGVSAILWADKNGIVQWVEPEKEFQHLFHYSLLEESKRRDTYFGVKDTQEIKFTPILDSLVYKQKVFGLYIPLFKKRNWDGVFIVGFKPEGFFNKFLKLDGYSVELSEDGNSFYANKEVDYKSTSMVSRFTSIENFHFRGLKWKIKIIPDLVTVSNLSSSLPMIAMISGVFISLLLGFLVELFLQARRAESQIIQEMNEKKEQARLLAEHQTKLVAASKFASLGEMAGGIAHEINNPLAIIYGKAQQIRMLYEFERVSKESILRHIESIEQTIERIAKIISGLRSFARDSNKDPFLQTEIKNVIEETLAFCRERFKNNSVDLSVDFETESIKASCRSYQISQVILNLLNNAFDAAVASERKWVKVSISEVENGVELAIMDSGAGVQANIRDKVMLPFFTTKEIGHGSGLGLSISQGIVSEHRGKLYLDDRANFTRFVVWLPRAQI